MRHEPGSHVRVPSAPHAGVASRVPRERRRIATLSRAALACFQSETVMSSREDVVAMQVRIAKAESERGSWRGSGRQEKYLEAYWSRPWEFQLDRLRKAPPSALTAMTASRMR